MSQRGGAVHVVTTRRRYKGHVYATHLLRRSYREGEKVKNHTLGNLSGQDQRGSLRGQAAIGVRVGRVLNRHEVGKHFALDIAEQSLDFHLLEEQIAAEAALDGIYVIRACVPKRQMSAADAVRDYKALADVERAFRSLETVDLKVRPIHHRLEDRVRAHIFLCMLAYYVEWHLREAWRPMLFADEDQVAKAARDPVAPAARIHGCHPENSHSHFARRHAGAQLADFVRRTLDARAQYLPYARVR